MDIGVYWFIVGLELVAKGLCHEFPVSTMDDNGRYSSMGKCLTSISRTRFQQHLAVDFKQSMKDICVGDKAPSWKSND